jgi:hypothetical protein
MKGTIKVPS